MDLDLEPARLAQLLDTPVDDAQLKPAAPMNLMPSDRRAITTGRMAAMGDSHAHGRGDYLPDGPSLAAVAAGHSLDATDESYNCWGMDPMELDYDLDLASWVHSWHLPPAEQHLQQQQQPVAAQTGFPPPHQPTPSFSDEQSLAGSFNHAIATAPGYPNPAEAGRAAGPNDLLFPDDETAAIATNQWLDSSLPTQNSRLPGIDLNDPATLQLYDKILVFSRDHQQDGCQLTFEGCDSAKEAVLHNLAVKCGINYSYDAARRTAHIWKHPSYQPTGQDAPFAESARSSPWTAGSTGGEASHAGPLPRPALSQPNTNWPRDRDGHRKQITSVKPLAVYPASANMPKGSLSGQLVPLGKPARQRSRAGTNASASSSLLSLLEGLETDGTDGKEASPSFTDKLSSSWNIFHSGISSRRPRGRRGPLSARSRKEIKDLEWAGGACWRCKILRRKCDPGDPCKNCPAPDLREDAPPWPLIGCRRGNIRDWMPPQILCPRSRAGQQIASLASHSCADPDAGDSVASDAAQGQPEIVSQCFRDAEVQRLSDNKLILDNPTLFMRNHGKSPAAHHYSQIIREGRHRASGPLSSVCHLRAKPSTYSELIAEIAWELTDNSECLALLEVECVESLLLLLETACLYEVKIGKSPMIGLSIVCLRCCLDALRLHSAGLLSHRLHTQCRTSHCTVDCFRELATCIDAYIEELSLLMFRKVNLRDRRWWLSTFYSLCIQAYVRRALLLFEQQLLHPGTDDIDTLSSTQYLHLVTVLFTAVSFQYDPLVTGNSSARLQQSLLPEEAPQKVISVPDEYFASGRVACGTDMWINDGIKSSYQFLTKLLSIGSLDFDSVEALRRDAAMSVGSGDAEHNNPCSPFQGQGQNTDPFASYSTANSSKTSFASTASTAYTTGVTSPTSSGGQSCVTSPRTSLLVADRRNSVGSIPSRLSVSSFPARASDLYNGVRPLHSYGRLVAPSVESVCSASQDNANAHASTNAAANANANAKNSSALLVCTCCPKRPQSFASLEELKTHQTKKPHICAFCGRRFSRMNEAERHITTIHLRPFSWSCGRMTTPLSAFQVVKEDNGDCSICGFCGRQFRPMPGEDDPGEGGSYRCRLAAHIEVEHKLFACKASKKKFFREDMFGQHLKFSHAAEPGIWLKCLENMCKEEEKAQVAKEA